MSASEASGSGAAPERQNAGEAPGRKLPRQLGLIGLFALGFGLFVVDQIPSTVVAVQDQKAGREAIPVSEYFTSPENIFRLSLVPNLIFFVVLAILIMLLRWWRPVLKDDRPLPRWMLVVPIVMGSVILLQTFNNGLWTLDIGLMAAVILGSLMIGIKEEILFRGFLLVGLRQNTKEWAVWLVTTLVFGFAHATTAIVGGNLPETGKQIVVAIFGGTFYYITRRVTGSIWLSIILHGMWDASIFAGEPGGMFTGVASMLTSAVFWMGVLTIILIASAKVWLSTSEPAQPLEGVKAG